MFSSVTFYDYPYSSLRVALLLLIIFLLTIDIPAPHDDKIVSKDLLLGMTNSNENLDPESEKVKFQNFPPYQTLMLNPQVIQCSEPLSVGCPSPRSVTVLETKFFVYDYWPVSVDRNYMIVSEFWDRVDGISWEPRTFKVLKTILQNSGDVKNAEYLDFGAWIGPTVLFAANFASRVWALEPDTMAAEMLVANFEISKNSEIRKKSRIFHECIAEKSGTLKIQGLGQSGSRIRRDSIKKFEHEVSGGIEWNIPCRSLPQFYKDEGMKNLRLVKMDVEGAELSVFPSLRNWLIELDLNRSETGGKPAFWLSLHRPYWVSPELSEICDLWRVFALWTFVYNDQLVDVSSKFKASIESENNGDHCWSIRCSEFCEFLLTDKQFEMT